MLFIYLLCGVCVKVRGQLKEVRTQTHALGLGAHSFTLLVRPLQSFFFQIESHYVALAGLKLAV